MKCETHHTAGRNTTAKRNSLVYRGNSDWDLYFVLNDAGEATQVASSGRECFHDLLVHVLNMDMLVEPRRE